MSDDVIAAMARLKKALEKRMRLADRAEELAARERDRERERERGGAPRAIRAGALAAFDTAGLGRKLRPMLEYDGRGWRALAAEIGVTASDLSRVMAGQSVAYEKVRAICEWAGLSPDRFYRRPAGAPKARKTPRRTAVGRFTPIRHPAKRGGGGSGEARDGGGDDAALKSPPSVTPSGRDTSPPLRGVADGRPAGGCFTGKALKQVVGSGQSAVGMEPGEAMP